MRRDRAVLPAPGPTAGAPVVLSRREMTPLFLFAAACYLVSPYLGLSSREVDARIAELWPPGGVGFVLLTTIWYAGHRLIAATCAFMAVAFVVTALVMGQTPFVSGWMAALAVCQSLLMVGLYRHGLGRPGWVPESPKDIAVLLYAAVGSSLVTGLAGGYPLLHAGDPFDKVLWWWVLRNTVFCFVGAATFMVLFFRRREEVLAPSPWYNRVGLVLTVVICVFGTYQDPRLPLSWLLMIPSVWGGLTLTIRGTAYSALGVALSAAAMTYLPQNQFGYTGALPASSVVDLLVIASTAFAFLLTLMRDQRARLIGALDAKHAEAESQRELLAAVFEHMSDGVMIAGKAGIEMHNTAARHLVGRPIPHGRPSSWVGQFDATLPDGTPMDDDDIRAALFGAGTGPASGSIELRVEANGTPRILELTAKPLETNEGWQTLLLLSDVTAQRARLRELTNFAGMVAHDLRGPLTVVDGWLETLEDDAALALPSDPETIAKARDASRRMNTVIEDWLGYTVVQNGQLRQRQVKLIDAVEDVVETRRAGGDVDFEIDVAHAVRADAGLLRQLLDNLVGNAVKYTPLGRRPYVAIRSRRDVEPGWVRVDVIDHGMGIPRGEEELIFEEFHRGSAEGRSAGTGLGLALTRRIVALHGGQMSARRHDDGPGSTFTFTLPEG